jgi:hypothetical protein
MSATNKIKTQTVITRKRILENLPASQLQLRERLDLSASVINRWVIALRNSKHIHISGYVDSEYSKGTKSVAIYSIGPNFSSLDLPIPVSHATKAMPKRSNSQRARVQKLPHDYLNALFGKF